MKRTDEEKWREFLQEIMDHLDVKAEYESFGVRFTDKVTPKGWAECYASDRDENNPSAAVNLTNGQYVDLGGGGSAPFFHFAVRCGKFPTFSAAIDEYARRCKLKSKMPPSKKGMSFWGNLSFKSSWNPLIVRGIRNELEIKESTLRHMGSVLAGNSSGEMCVCLPVYCPDLLFDGPQSGFVLRNAYGGTLTVMSGPGMPPKREKNKSVGTGGIVNKYAIQNWSKAEVVYKTEGISDLLKLHELIPDPLKETHVVITNSDGADASSTPWRFAPHLAGKKVVICHDADEPGQYGNSRERDGGARRWVAAALAGGATEVINLRLPYDIVEKKGKDVRDWINEGGDWEGFQKIVEASEHFTRKDLAPENDLSDLMPHQRLLKSLDLIVLGHLKSGHVVAFNSDTMRQFTIKDIDRFSYNKMLIHIGAKAVEKIHSAMDGECPPDRFSDIEVRRAISEEAGVNEITRQSTVGLGMWRFGDRMIAVGAGEWLDVTNTLKPFQQPMVDGKIIDFGESSEAWYDDGLIHDFFHKSQFAEWRKECVFRLQEIFGLWGNHKHPDAEMILTGLCLATWMQQAWPIRPWVGITGESNCGKTILFEMLAKYYGNLNVASVDASVAGIRSKMKSSTKVLLLDEFEQCPERPKILAMLMGATRGGELNQTLRSNANQESVSSNMHVIPWLSAIEHKADKQSERNRYISLEMTTREGMDAFIVPNGGELHELRNKSIAIVFRVWKRALELGELLTKSLGGDYSRVGELYSVPVAAYAAALGYSDAESLELFNRTLTGIRDDVSESRETEQSMLLGAILKSKIFMGAGQQKQTSELMAMADDPRDGITPNDYLARNGLKRISPEDLAKQTDSKHITNGQSRQMHLFVDTSASSPVKRVLLKDVDYGRMNISAILKRCPGSFVGRQYLAGSRVRGIYIPVDIEVSDDKFLPPKASVEDDLTNL